MLCPSSPPSTTIYKQNRVFNPWCCCPLVVVLCPSVMICSMLRSVSITRRRSDRYHCYHYYYCYSSEYHCKNTTGSCPSSNSLVWNNYVKAGRLVGDDRQQQRYYNQFDRRIDLFRSNGCITTPFPNTWTQRWMTKINRSDQYRTMYRYSIPSQQRKITIIGGNDDDEGEKKTLKKPKTAPNANNSDMGDLEEYEVEDEDAKATAVSEPDFTQTQSANTDDQYDKFLHSKPMTMEHAMVCYNNFPPHKHPVLAYTIALMGDMAILQQLRSSQEYHIEWDGRTCAAAAERGDLPLLRWLRTNQCPWDATTATAAATAGHLHILQWYHINNEGEGWDTKTYHAAARNGHLSILQWMYDNNRNRPPVWDAMTCALAASRGRLEIVQYLRDHGCDWDEATCEAAATYGHLDILQYARKHQCPWDRATCSGAARNGHLHIVQWARDKGCEWDEDTCSEAALNGHLDVLHWARSYGCPWDEWTCHDAASNGHLHIIKWARSEDCPWDEYTCAYAAENGHLRVLQWCRANGCPWDENTPWKAAMNGHYHVVQWAHENYCPWDEYTVQYAQQNGHHDIVQYAIQNGCPAENEDEKQYTVGDLNRMMHDMMWGKVKKPKKSE